MEHASRSVRIAMAMFGHLRPRTSTNFRIRDLTSVFRSRKPTAYAGTVRSRRNKKFGRCSRLSLLKNCQYAVH